MRRRITSVLVLVTAATLTAVAPSGSGHRQVAYAVTPNTHRWQCTSPYVAHAFNWCYNHMLDVHVVSAVDVWAVGWSENTNDGDDSYYNGDEDDNEYGD